MIKKHWLNLYFHKLIFLPGSYTIIATKHQKNDEKEQDFYFKAGHEYIIKPWENSHVTDFNNNFYSISYKINYTWGFKIEQVK